MRLSLDIVQRTGDALAAVGSIDRKRAALVGGLNIAAVALAFGALHLGGTIVEGARDHPSLALQPSPEPIVAPAAQVSAPIPHPAPALLAATPDAATLFRQPITEPAVLASTLPTTGGIDSFSTAGTVSPAQPAAPTPAAPGRDHAHTTPAVLASLAPTTAHATDVAAAATAGPLMLTDALLDADQGVGISAVSNISALANTNVAGVVAGFGVTGLGTSVSATANAAAGVASATASATAGVAASVSSAASGGASGVASGVAAAAGAATGAR